MRELKLGKSGLRFTFYLFISAQAALNFPIFANSAPCLFTTSLPAIMAESAAAAAASSGPKHHALKESWSFWEQRVEKKGDEKWRERALQVGSPQLFARWLHAHFTSRLRAGLHSRHC